MNEICTFEAVYILSNKTLTKKFKLLLRSSYSASKVKVRYPAVSCLLLGGDEFKCMTYSESSLKLYNHSIGCAWQH